MKNSNDEFRKGRCLECGAEFSGRKDKKFCSLTCKNNYNNRRYHDRKQYREKILAQLSRNYDILEGLLTDNQAGASLEELSMLGFDSRCLTGFGKGNGSHECCSCFDISYYRTGSKIFGLRRTESGKTAMKKYPPVRISSALLDIKDDGKTK